MAVAFRRGSTTGPNDLSIIVRDAGGNLIDPYRLEYAVYDATTGVEVLVGSPVNLPIHVSTGHYYAQVLIAADCQRFNKVKIPSSGGQLIRMGSSLDSPRLTCIIVLRIRKVPEANLMP